MKYTIYKSDTRKDDFTREVKSFDDFFDCMNAFDSMVEKFMVKVSNNPNLGSVIEREPKNFVFRFETGDSLELFFI